MKWLECNIYLKDYNRTNEVLKYFIARYINLLYAQNLEFTWHYFREPQICLRIGRQHEILCLGMQNELHNKLIYLEDTHPELYDKHLFGAFAQEGKEYIGETDLYGEDAWELCYKRWEAGSNLALLLCITESEKSLPFHYTRDIHLFENQLGFELSDEITILLKWVKRLMECDGYYAKWLDEIDSITKETKRESKLKGV